MRFNAPYHFQLANNEQVGYSLADFGHDHGAPNNLTFDSVALQVGPHTIINNIYNAVTFVSMSQHRDNGMINHRMQKFVK